MQVKQNKDYSNRTSSSNPATHVANIKLHFTNKTTNTYFTNVLRQSFFILDFGISNSINNTLTPTSQHSIAVSLDDQLTWSTQQLS